MSLKTILTTLVVGGALAGCSGSVASVGGGNDSGTSNGDGGGGGDSGTQGVSAAQAAADVASAYCGKAEACAPAYVTLGMGDVATCQAAFAANVMALFGASGSMLGPSDAEACAQAITGEACGDLLSRKTPAACKFKGSLADGTACAADSQCANGRCRVAANAVCGTCGSVSPVGGSCGVDADCVDGAHCASGSCVAYGQEGASCSANSPCRPDLGCVGGACGTPKAAGGACSDSSECDTLHGVFCDPAMKACATAAFAPSGQACGYVNGVLTACRGPQGVCANVSSQSYVGTCAAVSPAGGPCDTTKGPTCGAFQVCAAGKCAAVDPGTCQ